MDFERCLSAWITKAQEDQTRFCVWLTGKRDWVNSQLHILCRYQCIQPLLGFAQVLSDQAVLEQKSVLPHRAKSLLGRETELLVYDAFAGINPDALGQTIGMIKGGGVFILLSADPSSEDYYQDPEKQRLTVEPYTTEAVGNHFLKHFKQVFTRSSAVIHFDQNQGVSAPRGASRYQSSQYQPSTHQPSKSIKQPQNTLQLAQQGQKTLVQSLVAKVEQNPAYKAVITAGRGRGKSAVLGMLVARLLKGKKAACKIAVTAPQEQALVSFYKHAELSAALQYAGNSLDYLSPIEAAQRLVEYDVLLVDEAAGIAVHLLEAYQRSPSVVIYATTTQGYEGTGQGFRLRFLNRLKPAKEPAIQAPVIEEYSLTHPIRWSDQDPLEQLFNKALLLDCHASMQLDTDSNFSQTHGPDSVQIRKISQAELAKDILLLEELFALLTNAHYRTTPGDLRILLDSPNLHLWIAETANASASTQNSHSKRPHLLGACLVAQEGPIEDELASAIWQGRRRPRGHLIPQLLSAQEGFVEATQLTYMRVVRIAVSFASRRQGIAQSMLQAIEGWSTQQGIDILGAAFSASSSLLNFWCACGARAVRAGTQLDVNTGSVATLVVKSLRSTSQPLLEQWVAEFQAKLPYLASGWLRPNLGEAYTEALISAWRLHALTEETQQTEPKTEVQRWQDLYGFAYHHRSFESTAYSWQQLLEIYPLGANSSQDSYVHLVRLTVLEQVHENSALEQLIRTCNLQGQKALISALRQAAQTFYQAHYQSD